MHPSRSGRLTYAAGGCLAALALVLGGCGGQSGPSGASESGTGSSPSTPSATASSPDASGSTAAGLDSENFAKVLTAAQRKAGSFTFEMTSKTAGQTIEATGAAKFTGKGQPDAKTLMKAAGQRIKMVVVDGVYYLRSALLHAKKPWLKIDPNAKSGMGALIGRLGAGGSPTGSLEAFFGASKVTPMGSATVAGTPTTKYDVVVPRKALRDAMHYPKQVASLLPEKLTYRVWVDADRLVRRIHLRMDTQGQTSTTDMVLDDYGKPVTIQAPPPSKTTTKSPLPG